MKSFLINKHIDEAYEQREKTMGRNIKDRLFIATISSDHEEIAKKYGVGTELDQFCQAERMDEPLKAEACAEIESLLEINKSCVLHAPFSELYPAAIDPKARALAMERLRQAAGFAVGCGAKKMVVHSGYVPMIFYKEWHEDRSVEFWEEFMAGRGGGLKIVIENVMDDEPYMMLSMIEKIKNPDIRLCLDVGHAACVSDVPVMEWLEATAPYLGHIHIHNNDGSHDYHRSLDEGIIDMESFLDRAIELCSPETTFTVESLDGQKAFSWLHERRYI